MPDGFQNKTPINAFIRFISSKVMYKVMLFLFIKYVSLLPPYHSTQAFNLCHFSMDRRHRHCRNQIKNPDLELGNVRMFLNKHFTLQVVPLPKITRIVSPEIMQATGHPHNGK